MKSKIIWPLWVFAAVALVAVLAFVVRSVALAVELGFFDWFFVRAGVVVVLGIAGGAIFKSWLDGFKTDKR